MRDHERRRRPTRPVRRVLLALAGALAVALAVALATIVLAPGVAAALTGADDPRVPTSLGTIGVTLGTLATHGMMAPRRATARAALGIPGRPGHHPLVRLAF